MTVPICVFLHPMLSRFKIAAKLGQDVLSVREFKMGCFGDRCGSKIIDKGRGVAAVHDAKRSCARRCVESGVEPEFGPVDNRRPTAGVIGAKCAKILLEDSVGHLCLAVRLGVVRGRVF